MEFNNKLKPVKTDLTPEQIEKLLEIEQTITDFSSGKHGDLSWNIETNKMLEARSNKLEEEAKKLGIDNVFEALKTLKGKNSQAGKRLISYIDENGNILEEYTGTGSFVDEDYEIIEDPNDEQFEMGFGNQRFAPSAFMGNKIESKLVKTKPKK
jgi:hypothetical protein